MCRCLQVSTRSYYDWRNNKHTKHKELSDRIIENIKTSYSNSEKLYGSIRITADLKHTSTPVSRSTVVKYIRLNGIRSVLAHKFRVKTTDSNHKNNIAPNLLDRNFEVDAPNKVWVSDITYIAVNKGFIYLTVVIDLFDRKIIGWSLSSDMTAEKNSYISL